MKSLSGINRSTAGIDPQPSASFLSLKNLHCNAAQTPRTINPVLTIKLRCIEQIPSLQRLTIPHGWMGDLAPADVSRHGQRRNHEDANRHPRKSRHDSAVSQRTVMNHAG